MKALWGALLVILAIIARTVFAADFAAEGTMAPQVHKAEERVDRATDAAALSAKLAAIKTILRLLDRQGFEDRRVLLMMRLVETYQETSEIDYRIRYSEFKRMHPESTDVTIPASEFMQKSLDMILVLDKIQEKSVNRGRMSYLKAVAFRALGRRDEAIQEFLSFVQKFPMRSEILDARFAAIRLMRDKKDFTGAIAQLKAFQVKEQSPYEAFRLELLYKSHMDLDDVLSAVQVAEMEITRVKHLGMIGSFADFERAADHLLRVTVRGFEQGKNEFTLPRLYAQLVSSGRTADLGRTYVDVVKTLRVKDWRPRLIEWRELLRSHESQRTEWKEILWVTAEYELLNGQMKEFRILLTQIQAVIKASKGSKDIPAFREKIEIALLEKAQALANKLKEMRSQEDLDYFRKDLNAVYLCFVDFAPEQHPKAAEVRLALAENSFRIKEFAISTQNYLWVARDLARDVNRKGTPLEGVTIPSLVLKAVGARYEEFRAQNRFPKALKPTILVSELGKQMEPRLAAWLSWIERYRSYQMRNLAPQGDAIDSFEFEALRLLYAEGFTSTAVKRMVDYAFRYPQSVYAMPSAQLAIDTYVLSSHWANARETSIKALGLAPASERVTGERLREIASESTYQLALFAYQSKDSKKVIEEAERYLKDFAGRSREKDSLALAVQAALMRDERVEARKFTDQLIAKHSSSPEGIDAYRLRSQFNEDDLDFVAASQDMRRFLISEVASKSGEVAESLEHRKHSLFLAWLSGDSNELKKALEFPSMCEKALKSDCERYQGLLLLSTRQKLNSKEADAAAEKAISASLEVSTKNIWTLVLLLSDLKLTSEQRFRFLDQLATGWGKLDPLLQLTLFPHFMRVSQMVMDQRRKEIGWIANPDRGASWIRTRTQLLEDFELKAKVGLTMPWTRVQVSALGILAMGYLDFRKDLETFESSLKGLPEADLQVIQQSLAELKDSLREKTIDFGRKALNIASRWGVEDEETLRVVKVLAQFPELQTRDQITLAPEDILRLDPLNQQFMSRSEKEKGWGLLMVAPSADADLKARVSWSEAIEKKNWARAGFVLRLIKEKNLWSEQTLARARLVLFDALGARSEALVGFEYSLDQMDPARSQSALTYAVSLGVHSFSKSKTLKALKLVDHYWRKGAHFVFSPAEARLYLYAAKWSQAELPARMVDGLMAVGIGTSSRRPASGKESP